MRVYLLVIASLFFYLNSFGQDNLNTKAPEEGRVGKFYVRVLAGYGFPTGRGYNEQTQQTLNSSKVTRKLHSYGKGVNISAAVGYMVSKSMGFELNFGYHIGLSNKVNNVWVYDSTNVRRIEEGISYKANYYTINPNFIITVSDCKYVQPYVKAGPSFVFAKGTTSYEREVRFVNSIGGTESFDWEWTGGYGTGFSSSIGLKIKTKTEDVAFVVEAGYNTMGFSFKKGKRTNDAYQSIYLTKPLTVSDREVEYVDEIDNKAVQDPNKPTQKLRYKSNANSFGLNIGIHITI